MHSPRRIPSHRSSDPLQPAAAGHHFILGLPQQSAVDRLTQTLATMLILNRDQTKWWLSFLLAAFLPLWFIPLVIYFGGWIVEEVDYDSFHFLVFLCFPVALYSTIHYLRKPDRYFGMRLAIGCVMGIVLLLGSLGAIGLATCHPETIRLGKM